MLTPPPQGSSRADAQGWLCLVPAARRPVRRLPYTTAPPPRWLWCVLSMRRLRCYGRLEAWYAKQAAAVQVPLHTAQVCQVEGRRGQILLSVSAPSVYTGVAHEALPPTNYVFEAASLAELQRWSFALHATPLAHRLMATALPGPGPAARAPAPHGRGGPPLTAAQRQLEQLEAREAALVEAQAAIDAGTRRALRASEEMERRLTPAPPGRAAPPATRASKGGDLDPGRPPPPSSDATPAQRAAASVVSRQLRAIDPPPHAPSATYSDTGATASARGGSVYSAYSARSEAGSVISSVDHNQAASPLARSTSWDRLTGGRLGGRSRVEPGAARVEEEVVVTNPCVRTVLGLMSRARVS